MSLANRPHPRLITEFLRYVCHINHQGFREQFIIAGIPPPGTSANK